MEMDGNAQRPPKTSGSFEDLEVRRQTQQSHRYNLKAEEQGVSMNLNLSPFISIRLYLSQSIIEA